MIRRHMCSFNDTATTEIYTLALHDALPILSLPIRYEYAGKHFGFSLGPVINLNTKSSLKTRYRVDGKKHKDTTNDLKTNLLRSEEHTSELQSRQYLVCRLLLEKKTSPVFFS